MKDGLMPPHPARTTDARPVAPEVGPGEITLAVIIPAWRQPGLLAEAIASALGQQGAPPTAVVVVDDGCPFPDTAETAQGFAALHPGRVFLLRRRNGGLSAARNTGVEFVLAAFPACRALFFLDADNHLLPPFLARAWAAMQAAPPGIGWLYPDFDEFGGTRNWSAAGAWSLLQLLAQNYTGGPDR
jgi:glycosyltransferase involved in cell wall biosynthesis